MTEMIVSPLNADDDVEVVERKGLGHPDTVCDALAEALSRNLCREYRRRFGNILHHNVDKALLCAGRAAPRFGGGAILSPIAIYLAGRATSVVGTERIPLDEIAIETCRNWLSANLHGLDVDNQVVVRSLVQPGSTELRSLFERQAADAGPLANDTSIGVGYAPLSLTECLVLELEKRINERIRQRVNLAWGEDTKIMAIRRGSHLQLTIACAMIGRHVESLDAYLGAKQALSILAQEIAAQHGFTHCEVGVNTADDPAAGQIYLTVTGTSAEAGDDGEVGRGNRVNGLITPCRPMSLEATAGKNPVNHVGKLYNVAAHRMAGTIVAELPQVAQARCLLVSQIGAPVMRPAVVAIKVALRDRTAVDSVAPRVREIADDCLRRIPSLVDDIISGKVDLF